jgi:lipopolysaccharide biosynthesis glycosyltransferase
LLFTPPKGGMENKMKKQNSKETIPIFFAVDDCYVPYLCVALRSLIDNSTSKYEYKINILIDYLNDKNKELILSMQTENVSIAFVDVTDKLRSLCTRLHLRDYYSQATYYRFFIPSMFTEYDKGIYLDCDIVITDDIANMYRYRMGNNLVAAATEEVIRDIEVFALYSEHVLEIPRDYYFNAGVLVMNLKEMRRFRIEERFAKILSERAFKVAQDQDYLNVLCYGRVTRLPQTWNTTPMPDVDPTLRPKLTHYKINFKPWRYDGIAYAEIFWEYAQKTVFYESLRHTKESYSDAEKARDQLQYDNLVQLAINDTEKAIAEKLDYDEESKYAEV